MLKSILKHWMSSVPCRRRQTAAWQNHEVHQVAEVLEVRAVPVCISDGIYIDELADPGEPSPKLTVSTGGDGKQFASFYHPDTGAFAVEIKCHKKGGATIKSISKDITMKLRATGLSDSSFHVDGFIKTNGRQIGVEVTLS